MSSALAGRHIVVTRPVAQAAHMIEALLQRGAVPVRFPVLSILDVEDTRPIADAAMRLDGFDLVVFVSPNAVSKALDIMLRHRRWPDGLLAATMGRSSERELAARGVSRVIAPTLRFDSEALLELPELQEMSGRRVLICRGDGGREVLGNTLTQRGATIEYLTCYHRGRPTADPAPLLALWEEGRLDAVTLTSSEGFENFCVMVGRIGLAWLRKTPTFVPHQRIAEQVARSGITNVTITEPADDGLLTGLETYFKNHGNTAGLS